MLAEFFFSVIPSDVPVQRPLKVNGTFSAGVTDRAPFTSANVDSLHQVIPPDLCLERIVFPIYN